MTKQEEIREGIKKIFLATYHAGTISVSISDVLEVSTQELLELLHSQGVVKKVKCPDCEWSQFGEEHVGMTPCFSCNSTGYILEPLIKEGICFVTDATRK